MILSDMGVYPEMRLDLSGFLKRAFKIKVRFRIDDIPLPVRQLIYSELLELYDENREHFASNLRKYLKLDG